MLRLGLGATSGFLPVPPTELPYYTINTRARGGSENPSGLLDVSGYWLSRLCRVPNPGALSNTPHCRLSLPSRDPIRARPAWLASFMIWRTAPDVKTPGWFSAAEQSIYSSTRKMLRGPLNATAVPLGKKRVCG